MVTFNGYAQLISGEPLL